MVKISIRTSRRTQLLPATGAVRTALVGTSALVPVRGGRLAMGTWQGLFLCEFDGPRTRELWLTPIKEAT